jgi:putative nucleotidyltransferase with HDIG domain
MSKDQQIKTLTKKIQSLPTLPHVVEKLTKVVESPESTAKEVGKLIASDQVLGSKVLKLVNSPFYGFPGRISSISHAIILLGFNVIKGVVLSASVFDLMERSMMGLWEHSLGSAVTASTIARSLKMSDPEEISTAALLHDIGKVLVKVSLSGDYDSIISIVEKEKISFREAEVRVLGVDHADIGNWLTNEWSLPDKLITPITYHHLPEEAPRLKERASVVHIADSITRAFGVGFGGDPWVPKISKAAWSALDMDHHDLDALMRQVMIDLEEISTFSF